MHWILQDNLINPGTRDHLVQLLEARGVRYTRVKLVPIFNLLDGEVPQPVGPIFAYGSTGLGAVAKAAGWQPGYFDANLDYELMLEHYGDRALNAGAVSETLADMPRRFDRFFVRPVLDNKSFAGSVMTWEEFETFREGISKITDDQDVTLRLQDRIVCAPLANIEAEYRIFIINGRVVTGSRYKIGDQVRSSPDVPEAVTVFAQACADHWQPNEAFTLDVAATPEGLRVIELNSANSAGFYACDVGAIVEAVSQAFD
jgi:hypothetical protein